MSNAAPAPSSDPSGHLLPAGGKGTVDAADQEISRERRSVLETILAALQGRLEYSADPPSFHSPAEQR